MGRRARCCRAHQPGRCLHRLPPPVHAQLQSLQRRALGGRRCRRPLQLRPFRQLVLRRLRLCQAPETRCRRRRRRPARLAVVQPRRDRRRRPGRRLQAPRLSALRCRPATCCRRRLHRPRLQARLARCCPRRYQLGVESRRSARPQLVLVAALRYLRRLRRRRRLCLSRRSRLRLQAV